MEIKPWKKVVEPKVLAASFGRSMIIQRYKDPYIKKIEEYSQFKGADFASIVLAVMTGGKDILDIK